MEGQHIDVDVTMVGNQHNREGSTGLEYGGEQWGNLPVGDYDTACNSPFMMVTDAPSASTSTTVPRQTAEHLDRHSPETQKTSALCGTSIACTLAATAHQHQGRRKFVIWDDEGEVIVVYIHPYIVDDTYSFLSHNV